VGQSQLIILPRAPPVMLGLLLCLFHSHSLVRSIRANLCIKEPGPSKQIRGTMGGPTSYKYNRPPRQALRNEMEYLNVSTNESLTSCFQL